MENSANMRDILTAFFRNSRLFCKVFLGTLATGVLYLLLATNMYEASGSLLVKFGSDADAGVNKPYPEARLSPMERREIVESNLEILQSHDLLKSVLMEIGVARVYPSLDGDDAGIEKAIKKLQDKDLNAHSAMQSNILEISVQNQNPEVAAQIVSVLQDKFIYKQLEIFNKPQTDFLNEQVNLAREKLNNAQENLREFKKTVGVSALDEELGELLKQKTDAAGVAFQAVDDAEEKLSELLDSRAEMLATYRSNSPALDAVNHNIAEAKRQLQQRKDDLNIAKKKSALAVQNEAANKRIDELENLRSKYNDLARIVQIAEENYKNYLTRLEEARINETLGDKKITAISVVDSPSIPQKPRSPRKILTMFSALLAGLLLGGLAVVIREVLDERFYSPEQIFPRLKIPALASFPKHNEIAKLYNFLANNFAGKHRPIIQFISTYMGEGAEELAREFSDCAMQQSHENFAPIIAVRSGILHDGMALENADAVILVIQAERTRAPVAREVLQLINSQNGRVIGAVLTGRKLYIPRHVYNLFYHPENRGGIREFLLLFMRFIRGRMRAYFNRK